MSVYEALKEYAEAARWNGECTILHRHYGDEGFGTCGDRKCEECRSGFFAGLAEEAGLDHYAAKLVYAHGGIAAIEARMMPEDYEWPRYETGELLRCNDRYIQDGAESEVWHVDFDSYGEATILNRDGSKCSLDKGERVKRPAPKVLDADGVEIRAGDTVYVLGFGEPLTVKGFTDDGRVLMSFHDEDSLGYEPSRLTHEQPDSWQRIEEDCAKFCIEYCDEHGLLDPGCNAAEGDASTRHCMDCGDSCEERMARDLVRRAKALAERS